MASANNNDAQYTQDLSSIYPKGQTETFGVLAGRDNAFFNGAPSNGAKLMSYWESDSSSPSANPNVSSAYANQGSDISISRDSRPAGSLPGKDTFGILEGKDVAHCSDGGDHGKTLVEHWKQ
eukprot:TRINITY_DN213_c0_g1_i1.p1 TRINITY_DN213_c0_g1~~TRINITY_DN213_c0_g1_i1.p1  ORF type:complete len:122 (+),score=39.51 TRINITY_DN213_c0_g1_i1:111-476(+)